MRTTSSEFGKTAEGITSKYTGKGYKNEQALLAHMEFMWDLRKTIKKHGDSDAEDYVLAAFYTLTRVSYSLGFFDKRDVRELEQEGAEVFDKAWETGASELPVTLATVAFWSCFSARRATKSQLETYIATGVLEGLEIALEIAKRDTTPALWSLLDDQLEKLKQLAAANGLLE